MPVASPKGAPRPSREALQRSARPSQAPAACEARSDRPLGARVRSPTTVPPSPTARRRRLPLPPLPLTPRPTHLSACATPVCRLQAAKMEVEVPNCKCGQPAELRTVKKEGPNQGRPFWG